MYVPRHTRRVLPVFYVLDTSGSMAGEPIQKLNAAMEETILVLKDLAYHNDDAQIKIAVLSFASNVRWMQERGPEFLGDFVWEPLQAGGMTNMGAALRELSARLTPQQFLRSATGSLMPVIIFMTDGFANDEWQQALQVAKQNSQFRDATRIGFALGSEPDAEMIAKIVGDPESVIEVEDLDLFAQLIKFVSETATKVASVTHGVEQENLGRDVVHEARHWAGMEDVRDETSLPADVANGTVPIWNMDMAL